MKTIFRLLLIAAVVIIFLLVFAPSFVGNAANAVLQSTGNAKAYGSAQFIPNNVPGQGGNLQVNMQGLSSHFQYVVTLEQGQCGGNVLATIARFTPGSDGKSAADPKLNISSALLQQSLYVNVHQGSTTGQSIACGKVQINNLVQPLSATATPATATPASATTVPTATPVSTDNNLFPMLSGSGVNGFPQTGVAPAKNGSYDNYKFPRKY